MEQYNEVLEEIQRINAKNSSKIAIEYRKLRRYDVLAIGKDLKLIKPITDQNKSVLYYVTTTELFNILYEIH